jgi:uncharacterized protein YcaQ
VAAALQCLESSQDFTNRLVESRSLEPGNAPHTQALRSLLGSKCNGNLKSTNQHLENLVHIVRANVNDANWAAKGKEQDALEFVEMMLAKVRAEVFVGDVDVVRESFFDMDVKCGT